MRISDWSSDVCSSDLRSGRNYRPEPEVCPSRCESLATTAGSAGRLPEVLLQPRQPAAGEQHDEDEQGTEDHQAPRPDAAERSEEHTSELQSLMRISYAVFCLKKK